MNDKQWQAMVGPMPKLCPHKFPPGWNAHRVCDECKDRIIAELADRPLLLALLKAVECNASETWCDDVNGINWWALRDKVLAACAGIEVEEKP